jgi:hypothetical protein
MTRLLQARARDWHIKAESHQDCEPKKKKFSTRERERLMVLALVTFQTISLKSANKTWDHGSS